MLSLQSFLREGRVVGPCWEKLKPKGLGYPRLDLAGVNGRIPVNHPLDGATGAFYVKGPVTGYGGSASSLKVLKIQGTRGGGPSGAYGQPTNPESITPRSGPLGLIRAHHSRSPVPSRRKPR